MKTSAAGIDLVTASEGLRLAAYQDTGGVWTIGYGHTGPDVTEGLTCDKAQARSWLAEDLAESEDAVNELVEVELSQNQFDALVDFVYNIGRGKFRGTTLLKLLNAGNYAAAAQQFKRWNKDNGVVQAGLTKRRAAEERLFLS